jgi:DNA-binding GntR family transcriptional regulator
MRFIDLPDSEDMTLTERVYLALKSGILSLDIKPREILFIGDIADYYNISRTPVREALLSLEREGWVKSDGRKRGARVIVPSPKTLMEIVETQAVLEAHIAMRAAELLTDAQIDALETLLNKADTAYAAGEEQLCRTLGDEFQERIQIFVGNHYMYRTIKDLEEKVIRFRLMLWNKGDAPADESARQHRRIWETIRDRKAREAYQAMYDHTLWYEEQLCDVVNNM